MTDPNNAAQTGLTDAIAVLKGLRSSLATQRANGPSRLCIDSKALNDADDEVLRALKILVPPSKLRAEGVHAGEPVADTVKRQCPRCTGNGTILRLSGNGPDAYDVQEECSHCEGSGVVASAPVAGEAVAIPLRPLTEDERAAIEFYILNPTAAVRDLDKRLSGHAAPQASEAVRILFPAHLRKMWPGGEVQAWLDNYQGITPPIASAKGSLERYQNWRAEQAEADKDGVRSKGRQ